MSAHHPAVALRLIAVGVGALAAVSLVAPAASAKEPSGNVVISSTLPPPPTGCTPVRSFKITSDPEVGDTGLATVSVDYAVQACTSKQAVTVAVLVTEAFDPTDVVRDDPAAPLSGKFTIGVQLGVDYRILLTVRDAATGATIAQVDRLAAAAVPTKA